MKLPVPPAPWNASTRGSGWPVRAALGTCTTAERGTPAIVICT